MKKDLLERFPHFRGVLVEGGKYIHDPTVCKNALKYNVIHIQGPYVVGS